MARPIPGSRKSDGEDAVIQLALFGDPVPVDPNAPLLDLRKPAADTRPEHPEAEAIIAEMDDLHRQFDQVLECFEGEERDRAARMAYIDGNGRAATRYGLLSAV